MSTATTVPIPAPAPAAVPADVSLAGPPIPALDRLKLFSDRQWEEFVLEWADALRATYRLVERCGGAGDMGRDVIATLHGDGGWDNYQCKHYKAALTPSDIWLELGKLAYYTFIKEYPYPQRYYFVAPQGAGTKLSNLLKKPVELRAGLLTQWDAHCKKAITSTHEVPLAADLRKYIESLDFSIFEAVPPLRLIDGHAKTRWHVARFGGGLPLRPAPLAPPTSPAADEATYVRALLDAYSDYLGHAVPRIDDLVVDPDLADHFSDARIEFYSAEALRAFSRDTLPPGEFERLQEDVHAGIKDEFRTPHKDGYQRLLAAVKLARTLPLNGHSLYGRMSVKDHGGICHQLANDGKVRWVKP